MRPLAIFLNRLSVLAIAILAIGTGLAQATPALVIDAKTLQVLHAEDAGQPWYPASTAKLMTAWVVFEALRAGEVTLDTPVVLSPAAMKQASLHAGLSVGRAMTLEDALYALIAASANDVATAIAETVGGNQADFVARMNKGAAALGLTGSRFANPNGLPDRNQQVTARDLAMLGIAIDRGFPEYARFFHTGGVTVDGKEVDSYNELLSRYPGTIGMKTGFLCLSGRNIVALAERGERRLMVVLLGATTERERSERTAKFMTEAFEGRLPATTQFLDDLRNDAKGKPEDMRARICSDKSSAYEAERDLLYPMGLEGQETYLGPVQPVPIHAITTWAANPSQDGKPQSVPLPAAKP